MKSYDYEAVTYDGAAYCVECLPEGVTSSDEEVSPIFADAEVDAAVVCDACGSIHDYMNVRGLQFPHVDAIAKALANVRKVIDGECDVRLQVYDNGDWAIRYGSADYDQDHRGYWGASAIDTGTTDEDLRYTAIDLLDQAEEQHALA